MNQLGSLSLWVIQQLRRQEGVVRWSIKCLRGLDIGIVKMSRKYLLLSARGKWVVKKTQNDVDVVIEWPLLLKKMCLLVS